MEVSEATFAAEVVERSHSVPVVVDFWATWCGPCRTLGPLLEAAVAARSGEVVLAKVDVDANPRLATAFGVRGIPAVKAFRDGRIVAEFTGAQPRPAIEQFLDALLPTPADRLAAAGDETSLRQAVAADPGHAGARTALGRLLLARGDLDGAEEVLRPVEHLPEPAGMLARISLGRRDDLPAGTRAGLEALERGDVEAGLQALIDTVRDTSGELRDESRRAAVGILTALGEDHPLTGPARSRLAAAVF